MSRLEPTPPSLLDHYRQQQPLTAGRVGSLTADEAGKLRELWLRLLAEFDRSEPLPVLADDASDAGDITSLSLEPLVPLSSKDKDQRPSTPDTASTASTPGTPATDKSAPATDKSAPATDKSAPATDKSAPATDKSAPATDKSTPATDMPREGRGWLGWISGSRSAPATPEQETDDETVQDHAQRTRGPARIVPAEFRPLFGQPAQSRTLRSQFWQAATQAGDPDAWMLRFLRARGWRVDAALGMLLRALRWRAAQAIDELVFYGESRLHFRMMHSGLAFACTRDRLGLPVYVVRVRANVARGHSVRAVKRFLCWQMETAQLLAAGRADGRITLVFDMSAFTRENIDLQLVRTLITLLANYYPETLGILLLHVNSLLFSGLWALIAPFIDPAVKSKIVMTRTAADLAPFIDSAQLVAELGGPKRFVYDYALPTPDENACMADAPARAAAERAFADAVHAYEAHTSAWAAADALQPDGPGRAAARDRLRAAGRALDPYVRARTLYHRAGVVAPDHSVAL